VLIVRGAGQAGHVLPEQRLVYFGLRARFSLQLSPLYGEGLFRDRPVLRFERLFVEAYFSSGGAFCWHCLERPSLHAGVPWGTHVSIG
jgi:hypothetical protein